VAKIKDRALRPEYARKLAGDLGMEVEQVARAVASRGAPVEASRAVQSTVDSPQRIVEREALKLALQTPVLAGPMFDALPASVYIDPVHAAVREGIAEAGGAASATTGAVWIERVRDACVDLAAKALVGELAVEPLRLDNDPDPGYVAITLARVQLAAVLGQIRDLKSKVQRVNPVTNQDEYLALAGELFSLEQHARGLREQAVGGL